jgi:DNA modification methylase/DNA-directed RNA polymerase subunit RPC12/RpoP
LSDLRERFWRWVNDWRRIRDSWIPKVVIGDIRKVIPLLPDNFIDCVITSPPYWMQRDYGHPLQIGREETPEKYVDEIVNVFTALRPKLKKTATVFLNVGYKFLEEEMILIPEMIALEMSKRGYMLKNKIIWYKPNAMPTPSRNRLNNVYEPVFLFVKREAKEFYYLRTDEISEKQKTIEEYIKKFSSIKPSELLGVRVVDSLRSRETREGVVKGVRYSGNKVYEALVEWGDGYMEWISVGDFLKKYPEVIEFSCPLCGAKLDTWDITLSIANYGEIRCPHCGKTIPPSNPPKPYLPNNSSYSIELIELVAPDVEIKRSLTKVPRSSKYLIANTVISASPAGRLALTGEYFVVKRRWSVPQPLIAFYLRYWRERRGVSVKDIDSLMGYKDTAGHWFRYDFGEWGKGGSLPRPDDWIRLKEILGFDEIYDRVMTEVILELSTVKPKETGKNPGDVWIINLEQYPGAHFAIFPRELVERAIRLGCPPNGIVLDPFAGSGTVGEVSLKLRRRSLLIELKQEYIDLMRKRCGEIDVFPEYIHH